MLAAEVAVAVLPAEPERARGALDLTKQGPVGDSANGGGSGASGSVGTGVASGSGSSGSGSAADVAKPSGGAGRSTRSSARGKR